MAVCLNMLRRYDISNTYIIEGGCKDDLLEINSLHRLDELNCLYPAVNRFMAGGLERNNILVFLAYR